MSVPSSSGEFLGRLNDGNPSAQQEVFDRYFDSLYRAAEKLIGERLKRVYGPDDAAQSAMASFFRGMAKGRYHFERSGRLWALLVTILRHKIQERGNKPGGNSLLEDVEDARRSHEAAVELADAVEAAMSGLKPRHLEICRLFYQEQLLPGEISDRIGCSRWTVRRTLDEFGSRLEERLRGCSAP
jgi:RNA polymerase sigma factor (sigma-70 family)